MTASHKPVVLAALTFALAACSEKPVASLQLVQGQSKSTSRPTVASPPRTPVSGPHKLGAAKNVVRVEPEADLPEPKNPGGPEDESRSSLSAKEGDVVLDFPLQHTQVRARVSGTVARVEVTQLYRNPSANRLEAIYKFPLPANAAVTDMYFRIGNRVVYSEVKRKAEARQTYERAREEGRTAALTEQERPNLFTQSVANIPPGETVAVVIRYVNELPYDDGRYLFAFPTTIGPRYIPSTTQVDDASRITPPVIVPGFRSAHDLDLLVSIDPGRAFTVPAAKSHRIVTGLDGNGARLVALSEDDRLPNKDFVLAWSPVNPLPEAHAIVDREQGEDYLMLFVQPPAAVSDGMVRPRELVFLLDKSCSMSGAPLDTAVELVSQSLDTMGPEDTFQITAFDGAATSMSPSPLPNNHWNVAEAKQWMRSLSGSGGTEMLRGIRAALTPPEDPRRLRMVVFATDGFIGNEREILQAIEDLRGKARVFGFGIGSSVNRYLIDGMGRVGRGASDVVLYNEDPKEAVARLFKRLDRPVLSDLSLSFEGLEVTEPLPERMPDLFAGQPLVIVGKLKGGARGTLTLRGKLGTQPWSQKVHVEPQRAQTETPVLGTLWARRKVDELSFRHPGGAGPEEQEAITRLGLRFKLITAYTSLVAVERELKVDPGVPLTQVIVPNEMPEGVSFEAIFGPAGEAEATVTPGRVKPGDPELRVRAGEGALSVRVTLPFDGKTREAFYDASSGEHVVRFLVPPSTRDGRYDAEVEIAYRDGSFAHRTVPIKVDTAPAAIGVLSAPDLAAPGERIRFVFKPVLPLESLANAVRGEQPGEALKSAMEVKEVLVRAPWGEIVEGTMTGTLGTWEASFFVPVDQPTGLASFEVVASDAAGNVSRRSVSTAISGATPAPLAASIAGFALIAALLGTIVQSLRRRRAPAHVEVRR